AHSESAADLQSLGVGMPPAVARRGAQRISRGLASRDLPGQTVEPGPGVPRGPMALLPASELLLRVGPLVGLCPDGCGAIQWLDYLFCADLDVVGAPHSHRHPARRGSSPRNSQL